MDGFAWDQGRNGYEVDVLIVIDGLRWTLHGLISLLLVLVLVPIKWPAGEWSE